MDGVVAIVNGVGISEADFDKRNNILIKGVRDFHSREGIDGNVDIEMMKSHTLYQMILEEIQIQEAKRLGLEVELEEAKEHLESSLKYFGEDKLSQWNMTKEELIDSIAHSMVVSELGRVFMNSIKMSEDEMRDYFDAHFEELENITVNSILLKTDEMVETVMERMRTTENFRELTEELFDELGTRVSSGVDEEWHRGQMLEELESLAFNASVGEVLGPIKSEYGYHIIKVLSKSDDFDSLKDELINTIKIKEWIKYITNLIESAEIEIREDLCVNDKLIVDILKNRISIPGHGTSVAYAKPITE